MKSTNKLLIGFVAFIALAANAYAQAPRVQFKQMVEQWQQTPDDNALREKIIQFSRTLKPLPALPPEAERRMVRGAAAYKGATSVADYHAAAREFEQATLAAPWYGDAYFNLGVVQDKAGSHEAALRNLQFAQLASPTSREIKALIQAVEYRHEKTNDLTGRLEEPFRTEMQGFPAGSRWFCSARYDTYGKGSRQENWVVSDGTTAQWVTATWHNVKAPVIHASALKRDTTAPRQFWDEGIYTHNVYTIGADGQLHGVRRKGVSPAEAREDVDRFSCARK